MTPYIPTPSTLSTDHIGIETLIDFYHKAANGICQAKLDISSLNEMDANLSAVLLAISQKLYHLHNKRCFIELGKGHGIFLRNGLISHLQGNGNNNTFIDDRNTTVPLRTYLPTDDEAFSRYIKNDFLKHRSLENIPFAKKKEIDGHYCEIFANVDQHANSQLPIFTCGQYFPQKQTLKFTLVDLGVGFLSPIANKTKNQINTDNSAIIWALTDRHTTSDNDLGGFGLKDLRDYCYNNHGSLQICSGNGYINFINGRPLEKTLKNPFPGTIVNIIFRNI
jgi:hypothetical protein